MSESAKVIEQLGGAEVSKLRAPFCHRKIERLAIRAGISKPRVYVIPEATPNAFAVGLSSDDTAVAVTSGLLCDLDEHEIEAVLAHEIGHIQKGHSVEKTKIAMRALAISAAAEIHGRMIATSETDLTPGDDDSDDVLSAVLKIGLGVATAVAGEAVAASILTDTSFRSEFEADECSGSLTRKPWALARALQKLQAFTESGTRNYAPEVSQLFIVSPAHLDYQTHPTTEERISRLSKMSGTVPELAGIPTLFCTACGEKTDSDGNFCYWCGVGLA